MQGVFLVQRHRPRLLWFWTGWGMDERPFQDLSSQDYDVWVCFDYRSLDYAPSVWEDYQEVIVLAWSLGVGAALQAFDRLKQVSAWVFVNGTGAFRHPRWGIPPRIFDRTLAALKDQRAQTLYAFYQNMFFGEADGDLARFLSHRPQRNLKEIVEELEMAADLLVTPRLTNKVVALVGQKDRIIPARNQQAFWQEMGLKCHLYPWGHFPFYRFSTFEELLEEVHVRT